MIASLHHSNSLCLFILRPFPAQQWPCLHYWLRHMSGYGFDPPQPRPVSAARRALRQPHRPRTPALLHTGRCRPRTSAYIPNSSTLSIFLTKCPTCSFCWKWSIFVIKCSSSHPHYQWLHYQLWKYFFYLFFPIWIFKKTSLKS